MSGRSRGLGVVCLAMAVVATGGCEQPPRQTRGYVLISVDTLRADHLGVYGYGRDTSPFLDQLSERALVFEHAFSQFPGTLPSHMSMFTGLYPSEHGVFPPASVLDEEVESLPAVFRRGGFRTAGYTEGGYMSGHWGFSRGFEQFSDRTAHMATDVEVTLERAGSFLRGLEDGERFFLFIHTYAVHDPYFPPQRYRALFWDGEAPDTFAPTGPNLVEVNRGERAVTRVAVDYYEALYDAGIRYVDDCLRDFFTLLDDLRLASDTTVVLTSDHGEEFLDHGRLVHEQMYRELLHVPLIVVHPDLTSGRRIPALTQSIDIAPTLYELAGIEDPPRMSGRSLVDVLEGESDRLRPDAYAEGGPIDRTLFLQRGEQLFQYLRFFPTTTPNGRWQSDSLELRVPSPRLELRVRSFYEPRRLTLSVAGEVISELDVEPTPRRVAVDLGLPDRTVKIEADGCVVPAAVGVSADTRCLAFMVDHLDLGRAELYEIGSDPRETIDLTTIDPELAERLRHRLKGYDDRVPVGARTTRELPPEVRRQLEALGYL
ncbi:MAG: sulfatase [Acidobacteriota bacterium]|nr:sulfatase [Acidobacteriota bacterium]MDH3522073.1 sulfatase [Acidobacteriota bacterium]